MVVGLADARVPRRLLDVGGLVDQHRRVPGAHAVGGFSRSVRGLDHCRSAGGDCQIATRHELVGQRDVRPLYDLEDVLRGALLAQRRAQQPHGFRGRLPAGRVRREDHRILALDRVDGDADGGDVRTGHRDQRRNHAGWLRVLDEAPLRVLLDDAHALLTQRVAEDAEDLRAPGRFAFAHAALVHAHVGEADGRLFVPAGPGDGLAEPIDRRLIVGLDRAHRAARLADQLVNEPRLLRGNRPRCHGCFTPALAARRRTRRRT